MTIKGCRSLLVLLLIDLERATTTSVSNQQQPGFVNLYLWNGVLCAFCRTGSLYPG